MQLQRTDPRGAKRIKPRIEELVKIPVHQVITNKVPSTRFINGDRFDFVDEMLGDQFVLTISINGRPAVSYPIEEIEIAGRIKNTVPFDAQHHYFVVINDRRVKDIYVNPKIGMVGSRYDLKAIYTSSSIGEKQRPLWRALRNAGKANLISKQKKKIKLVKHPKEKNIISPSHGESPINTIQVNNGDNKNAKNSNDIQFGSRKSRRA